MSLVIVNAVILLVLSVCTLESAHFAIKEKNIVAAWFSGVFATESAFYIFLFIDSVVKVLYL